MIAGRKTHRHGGRIRGHPVYELSREDMFHVSRHTYARVQLEADESVIEC